MNFNKIYEKKRNEAEEVLQNFLPEETGFQKTVIEAMNYSLLAGGKRLRPIFMRAVFDLYGGEDPSIDYFMAAIEMVHTYSLVHDDLPAIDNDDYRRGRKTTHVMYGEAMGIFAGDGLLNYAFETAIKALWVTKYPHRVGKALEILGKKSGIYGMLGGQCVDVESEGELYGIEKLEYIYKLKTCALLEASFMIGAVLAGASEEQLRKMEQIAYDVGLAFQIQDDILDVIGNEELIGKPTGSDEKNNKVTYVTVKGIDSAKEDVKLFSKRALEQLQGVSGEKEFLMELVQSLITREK